MAKTFDTHRVSNPWWRVLTAARTAGVRFTLNSGRRTLAEQWRLYRNPPRDAHGNPVPVAFPSPNAPHIMAGRYAHAIDVDALDGGETRLQAWLEKHAVDVSNPVSTEAWHMVVPERQLVAFAKRLKDRAERERREKEAWARKRDIARKNGANFVDVIFREARRVELPVALGLAVIEKESGFKNVWGGDPSPNGGTNGLRFHEVTEARYAQYRRSRGAKGTGGMQGVGPAQLTWYSLQDEADRRGGCWNPEHNIAVAFDHIAQLIKAHGTAEGLRAYNGSGAAAEAYSRDVRARQAKWRERLGT